MGTNATWNRSIYPRDFGKNRKIVKKLEKIDVELLEQILTEIKHIKKLLKGIK